MRVRDLFVGIGMILAAILIILLVSSGLQIARAETKENPPSAKEGDEYRSPLGQLRGDQQRYEIRCWWVGKVWTCR